MAALLIDTTLITALWRLVWDAANTNPATILALISALTALMSTVVGLVTAFVTPLLSFHIMRRQIRATTVSVNRQAWINALRDDLAELLELLAEQYALASETPAEELKKMRARAVLLSNRVRLRLNPVEEDNKKLLTLIKALRDLNDGVATSPDKDAKVETALESAVSTSQEILKREWEVVKKGQ